jgi:hypothetical protein
VEAAIASGALPKLASQLRGELAALAACDHSSHSLLQLKKQALIIDLMHSCNVVEGLLGDGGNGGGRAVRPSSDQGGGLLCSPAGPPTSMSDWAWARQLRYYAEQVRVFGCLPGSVYQAGWLLFGSVPGQSCRQQQHSAHLLCCRLAL